MGEAVQKCGGTKEGQPAVLRPAEGIRQRAPQSSHASVVLWHVRSECGRPSAPGFQLALYPLLPVVDVTYFFFFI